MWRTPNVERENGRFKVPLTVAEALNMKAEDYEVLCSTARSAPEYAAPELNQGLAVMYAKAEVKVAEAVKRRKNSVKDVELLAKFKGDYPPTIMRMMLGEGIAEGIGFHPLAMQIAITSNALGKKEEEMLAASAGLIANHVSDGSRYNTPAKRTAELMRMFRYTQDDNDNLKGIQMEFTQHAQKQAQRRAIDPGIVDFIVGYGEETHSGSGCTTYRISREALRSLRQECPPVLWKRYRDRLHRLASVVSSDRKVVTAMHRYRPLGR